MVPEYHKFVACEDPTRVLCPTRQITHQLKRGFDYFGQHIDEKDIGHEGCCDLFCCLVVEELMRLKTKLRIVVGNHAEGIDCSQARRNPHSAARRVFVSVATRDHQLRTQESLVTGILNG